MTVIGADRILFGFHMPSLNYPGTEPARLFDRIVANAQAAEAAAFDMVTVMDHVYQIGVHGSEEDPMLEAYATLSALAMETERVLLATIREEGTMAGT